MNDSNITDISTNELEAPLDVRHVLNQTERFETKKIDDDIEFDMGNLTTYDLHPLDGKRLKGDKNKEQYLNEISTENVQRFVTQLLRLDMKRFDDATTPAAFVLPPPTTRLPREKPVPVPKPMTKWEKFAQDKGVGKHKRDRMVFDEDTQDWRPRYGFQRANSNQKDWIIEEKPGENLSGHEDPFEARKALQREKIKEQEKRQMINEKRADPHKATSALPATVALTNTMSKPGRRDFRDKKQIVQALSTTASSTASMGRFDTHRAEEPRKQSHRAKRDAVTSKETVQREKSQGMAVLDKMFGASAKPTFNIQKAVKIANLDEEQKNRAQRKSAPGKGRKRRNVQDATKDKTFTKYNPRPAKRQKK
eukprot:c8288_g1_i1.p1 GENE.c8288_g1_i1~~c8288_g1_i1.p1  ORF type:complete len:396 (+),score=108.80 c8288_g1_i1:94-1188(+)